MLGNNIKKLLSTLLLGFLLIINLSYGDEKPLIVGSEQDYPPFALGLTDDTASGFTVELWRKVAQESHLSSIVRVMPFHKVLQDFKAGKIDVLINLAQSDERRQFVDFTVPHVIIHGAIFVRNDENSIHSEADLKGKGIIVLNADLAHDYAVSKGWEKQLVLVDTSEAGFALLASGQYDALLLSKLSGQQTLEKLDLTQIIKALPIKVGFTQKFSFAVHKGNAELLAKINEGLALTKSNGVYDELYNKWFGVYEDKELLPLLLIYLKPIALAFLLIMAISFYQHDLVHKKYVQRLKNHKARLEAEVLADIALRKDLQVEVQTTLARMKMAITALNAGIWIWDFKTNELIWDDLMLALYNVPESLQKTHFYYEFWVSRLHCDDREESVSLLLECAAGRNSFNTEFRIVLDNGEIRYIRAAAALERNKNNEPVQMVGINLDITDLKTAEARIMAVNASLEKQVVTRTSELNLALEVANTANAAKTDFLANMSHEIRTPMNAVIGLAYLVQKQELSFVVRDMINKIDDASRSLLGVINECLDFSKIEANLLEIESVPFRLSDILKSLASIMTTLVGVKLIELCIVPAPKGIDYLYGDPIRLEQVLVNLVSNAIKFTEKGEVIVKVHVINALNNKICLRFSVRDTGCGIPADKHESIFQPFIQADNSTTRVYGGTGLGLTISRRLVNLMNGNLEVNSKVGVGSKFFFDLVLTASILKNQSLSTLPPAQDILIVENNATARRLLEATVISLGWNAYVQNSSEKALQLLTEKGGNYFSCLLLNYDMPEINGIQVMTQIQQQFGKEHCLIILMVTNRNRTTLLTTSSNSDFFDALISKPVTALSLANAIIEAKIKRGELIDVVNKSLANQQLIGLNLLVVDDSEINRDVARQILTGEGATIEVAENGVDALNQLMARPDYFHVVLMDVQMPIMDGYTTTQQIRSLPELQHLPIIALTAGAFKSQRIAALEAGMNDFIAKPFEVNALVECVKRLAQRETPAKAVPQTLPLAHETIPLIDSDNGLKKWRDANVYNKNLQLFLVQQGQAHEVLHKNLLSDDKTAAKVITHKLLGAAGALSLKRLVYAVKGLDDSIHEQANSEATFLRFTSVLSQTLEAINDYLNAETQQQSKQPTVKVTNISIIKELKQLITLLDTDDLDLIEPQLSILEGILPKATANKVITAVENFDFRGAETVAATLLTELFNSSKE
ncbi:MAG: transporter substrate-binding domain-containing protein [Methylococcales bacterium]|nr:transporter substrate-binding domain-containing protein [Methylococcales bacterium]